MTDIVAPENAKFKIGDYVRKCKGKSGWRGKVVGVYSTDLTELGYAVEADAAGFEFSVQIYPEHTLELCEKLKTYAISPISHDYLTKGMSYEVLKERVDRFSIACDNGDVLKICRWHDCAHILDGDWIKVTI